MKADKNIVLAAGLTAAVWLIANLEPLANADDAFRSTVATKAMLIAGDWSQWRGPNRDGKSVETGLLKQWPKSMKPLWTYTKLGKGYSTVAVTGGKLYTTGMVGERGTVFCLDLKGQELWRTDYGPEWTGASPGAAPRPRCMGCGST